jgi:hypothetical protein
LGRQQQREEDSMTATNDVLDLVRREQWLERFGSGLQSAPPTGG